MDSTEIFLRDRGPRVYVLSNARRIKDSLRAAGAHWDAERHQWWIGRRGRARLEEAVSNEGLHCRYVPEGVPFRGVETKVIGSARHEGVLHYVIWAGEKDRREQMKLVAVDASREFWTDAVPWVKQYREPRLIRDLIAYAEQMDNLQNGRCPLCAGEHPGCEICGGAPAPKVPLFLAVHDFASQLDTGAIGRKIGFDLGRPWPSVAEVKGVQKDGDLRVLPVPRVNFDIRHISKNGKRGVRVFFSLRGGRIYQAREHYNYSKDRQFYIHATPTGEAKEVSEQWVRKALSAAL